MSPLHILLRFVLCISLILNGSGVAVAATQMQMGDSHLTRQAMPPVAAMPGACHEMPGMEAPAPQHHVAAVDNGTPGSASLAGSPLDCSDSSGCDCSCAQQAQFAPTAATIGGAMGGDSTAVRPMKAGHPAPAMPHLIRPPIG